MTDKVVAEAQCPAGKKDVLLFDEALPGFGVRVSASGPRTFIFQYRQGPAVRRIPVGSWGKELTTAAARKKAEALRGQVRDHRDPVAGRRAARAAAVQADAARKAAEALAAYTVDVLIEQWATHHLSERSASYRTRVGACQRSCRADLVTRAPIPLLVRESWRPPRRPHCRARD